MARPGLATPELCREPVGRFGMAIRLLPHAFLTPAICLAAVTDDGEALKLVPERL
ncbi:MAG: hypothetical protein LBR80_06670 [Deltaproteobacteria bacterium]|jgi:hypothetical protein|nr:hypothetical protein [Deltaproteobacteria bacterium]